jgi:hypothetical protein
MKSGKCPKCQSTDIRVGPPGAGARGPMNKFAVSFWKNIVPERHICMSCVVHGAVSGRPGGPCVQ